MISTVAPKPADAGSDTVFDMVEEFHRTYGLAINEPFDENLIDLREGLLDEEVVEVETEVVKGFVFPNPDEWDFEFHPENIDKKKLTKELADVLYVTIGYAVTFGLPLKEVFAEVHKSNMSKLGPDGKPIYREDGKVLKGPDYKEPDLEKYFTD